MAVADKTDQKVSFQPAIAKPIADRRPCRAGLELPMRCAMKLARGEKSSGRFRAPAFFKLVVDNRFAYSSPSLMFSSVALGASCRRGQRRDLTVTPVFSAAGAVVYWP